MRQKYLREVWTFADLHREHEAPSFVHRIKGYEVKHIQTIGESFMIVNNKTDNVDVYSIDSAMLVKELNIQGR